jgi:hypothetical protein
VKTPPPHEPPELARLILAQICCTPAADTNVSAPAVAGWPAIRIAAGAVPPLTPAVFLALLPADRL